MDGALPPFPYDAKTWTAAFDIVTASPSSRRHGPAFAAGTASASIYAMLICEKQGFLFLKDFGSDSMDSVITWALFLYCQATEYMKQPGAEIQRSKKRLHALPPMAYDWEAGMWKFALLSAEEFCDVSAGIEAFRKQARDCAGLV